MNKKVAVLTGIGVIVAILVMLALLRSTPLGTMSIVGRAISVAIAILAFPMRVYVMYGPGEHGHWTLPAFISLLLLSGVVWGAIAGGLAAARKRRTAV